MTTERPDPEALLKRVTEEERHEKRGKLKIYLGAAPGVGKTYTMLQDAIAQQAHGLEVVVGVAESHQRQDIEALLAKLTILPRQTIDYHGKQLFEFDLDAALKCNPQLILIDEMAHTNAPELRHAKRWQDIQELLDRGIDVYTTLNVQHIESLNDAISQIIHAPVRETVPDSMLEIADTIELVDLPPEDLLKRLQEGKVYYPEQAALAKKNFFRKGNLIALRELALRMTAERVGAQVLLYRQGEGIQNIWPTKDKILVCVGAGDESRKLLRGACRIATHLKAEWLAVYVETPKLQSSETDRNRAIENLRFAEQLGATTHVLTGFDIVREIMRFAREQNVTVIMIWKQIRSRFRNLFFRNLSDEIVRNCGEIDVYIMTGDLEITKQKTASPKRPRIWRIYVIAIAVVAIATCINYLIYPHLRSANVIMIYLLGVVIVALFAETWPSILASILSVLAYDFFFVPPIGSFMVANVSYLFTLILMLFVTQIISHLIILARRQAQTAQYIEHKTAGLYTLSRQLAGSRGIDKLLTIGVRYIAKLFESDIFVLLPENNQLKPYPLDEAEHTLEEKEQLVAQWVYELGQPAGLGTNTLPSSHALYMPLIASRAVMGVLQVQPRTKRLFTPEQMHYLENCANQLAIAIEVDRLQEQTRKSEFQKETEQVRSTILQAVSHDLRTPLASLMKLANTQIEVATEINAKDIEKTAWGIYSKSEQLNRLINNLLQITHLESTAKPLQKQFVSIYDLMMRVLEISEKKLAKRPVNLIIEEKLPLIPLDPILIQEVLLNLIDNATKFTPPKSAIDIFVQQKKGHLLVCVNDHGPGIVVDEMDKLFEKFYRGRLLTSEHGLGLGLTVCQHIILAHGGQIWAENKKNGGASFCFTLPLV